MRHRVTGSLLPYERVQGVFEKREAKLSTPWKKMSSYTSSPRHLNEYDFDNDDIGPESCSDFDDERELGAIASDEGEKWKTDTRRKIV